MSRTALTVIIGIAVRFSPPHASQSTGKQTAKRDAKTPMGQFHQAVRIKIKVLAESLTA